MIGMTGRMARLVSDAEQTARDTVSQAAQAMEAEREIPPQVLDRLWEKGFLTLLVPKDYQGQGASFMEMVRVIEVLSEASASVGLLVMLQGLGLIPLVQYASDEQKERWFHKVVHERKFLAFALSEPGAFEDEKITETRAVREEEGYLITGRKVFVSRGGEADLVVVFAVTDPEAGLEKGLSAFVLEKGTQGFLLAGEARRPGLAAVPWCEYLFEECRVSESQRLGKEGQGYSIAARALIQAGPLLAATAVGLMQRALEFSIESIRKRGSDWRALNEFQPVEILLAEMSVELEASRAITYRAAEAFDEGAASYFGLSRHAKTFATQTALSVIERAIELFGNYGVLYEFPLRGMLDEALVLKGMLGANTLQRVAMVRELLRPEKA
jgi:alkylation response protein AidB-like acyl-CoA dehydrogenase